MLTLQPIPPAKMRSLPCCILLALFSLQCDEGTAFVPPSLRLQPAMQQPSSVVRFLETDSKSNQPEEEPNDPLIPENLLVAPTALLGVVAIATQAGAYSNFFASLAQMKENMAADPTDYWPAVNFWIFFAASHAILQPIIWISEVLHASPGPLVGDLVPVSFIVGNAVAIAAITFSKEVRLHCQADLRVCQHERIIVRK